jgi:hypothetical protein
MHTLLNDLDKNLTEFIALQKRTLIIKTYINHSDKEPQEQAELLEKIYLQRLDLENSINQDIEDVTAVLRENKALFSK